MPDDLTPEERHAIGQRLAEGRRRAAEAKGDALVKTVVGLESIRDAGEATQELAANGHPNLLDIADPAKWQMKVRVYLQTLDIPAADEWMEGIRLIATMAARVVRDQVYARLTSRCAVCDKPFKMGRPEGEAHYFDRDGTLIKIYCCHQAEYAELLKMAMAKEQAVKAAEERTAKAVRQALMDVRSRIERESP